MVNVVNFLLLTDIISYPEADFLSVLNEKTRLRVLFSCMGLCLNVCLKLLLLMVLLKKLDKFCVI